MAELKVFTFAPAWGLPTAGPFALKLLKWLDLAGLPYTQVIEQLSQKGPKGKNPWIELDGKLIADTEIIIELLTRRSGFDINAGLTPEQRGLSHAVRRMIEEHFHMVLEWELFVHPEGIEGARQMARESVPAPLVGLATAYITRHFGKQLHARGIARHSPDIIAAKARADLDAIEALIGDKDYLAGNRPCMADVSAYGLLMPMARWSMKTPAADSIKSRPRLMAYLNRIHEAAAERPAVAAQNRSALLQPSRRLAVET
jgi:glutathione S-transferase